MSTTGMLWRLMFSATPRQVFGALVATGRAPRLLSVEDYGTVLVFSPSRLRCIGAHRSGHREQQ